MGLGSLQMLVIESLAETMDLASEPEFEGIDRVIVYLRGCGVAAFKRSGESGSLELERLIFHPTTLEGEWHRLRPGRTFGAASILTALILLWRVFSNVCRASLARRNKKNCKCNPRTILSIEKRNAKKSCWRRLQRNDQHMHYR